MLNGLDCRSCVGRLKEVRGCEGLGRQVEIGGISVDRCPLRLQWVREGIEWIKMFRLFNMGFLPDNRGVLYNSSRFIEVIMMIEGFIEELREDGGKH